MVVAKPTKPSFFIKNKVAHPTTAHRRFCMTISLVLFSFTAFIIAGKTNGEVTAGKIAAKVKKLGHGGVIGTTHCMKAKPEMQKSIIQKICALIDW